MKKILRTKRINCWRESPMEFVKEKDAELSTKFMEQGKTKIHLAVCSGILATCGSLFGKLAGGAEFVFLKPMLLKVSLLVLMVVTNTIGCTFFVKALNGSESSLPATVASTAMNYVCSAFLGFIIFGESTSLTWWCGASLVILGLILICYTPNKENSTSQQRKLKQQ
ncbi:transmembrane protein 42-like isoform X1 [Vespula pensylvanica]|uniref:transmembrane protein 42-like isoform X1 n=1 Tax=Vespula pensylvanica TaxID=30213 RepID=UPI001CBA03F7|nr:transmembrane protein 42-like isoform X1 [Vespula pensylvanica]